MKRYYLVAFIILQILTIDECIYYTSIKLVNLDIEGQIRTQKNDYNGQTVKINYKLVIKEQLSSKNKQILQDINSDPIKTIESEIYKIPKMYQSIMRDKYWFTLKMRNIYWKKYKEIDKNFDFKLKDVKSFVKKKDSSFSHYETQLATIQRLAGEAPKKDDGAYYSAYVPCDTKLPLLEFNANIKFTSSKEDLKGEGCSMFGSKTITNISMDLNFDIGINFMGGKNHMKEGGRYLEEYFLRHKLNFDKFKSYPYKSQIGKFLGDPKNFQLK